MAAQSTPITIQGWQRGIGASPYVGFGKIVGMDIFRKPGIIQAGVALNQDTTFAATLTGMITAEASDADGNTFTGTMDGKVYRNGVQIFSGSNPIHDLIVFNDYLIVSKSNSQLDLYGPISVGASYTTGWKNTLETSVNGWKKMIVGQDDVIYIGNETKLANIVGFTAGTGTLNTSCVNTAIPDNRIIQSICELNRYVVISSSFGNGTYGNTRLFFIDRGTADALKTSFSISIGVNIPERKVNQLIAQNNRLFFFGTDTGTVYTSNSTSYSAVAVIPGRLQAQNYTTYPNAVAIVNNEVLFGIGGSFNSAFDTVYGVYSLRENSLITRNIVSTGEYGQTTSVLLGVIYALANGAYNVSYQTGASTYGFDVADFRIATAYKCWFESPFYETGTAYKPRSFQTAQFNFGNNLVSGQALKFYYRQANNAPWTLYGTYSYVGTTLAMTFWDGTTSNQEVPAGQSGFNSFASKFPVTLTTNIQVKVSYDTGISAPYGSNIELQSVILI